MQVDNLTDQARDVWWLPRPDQATAHGGTRPIVMHRNIAPHTNRILHVGKLGDQFLLVNAGTVTPTSRVGSYTRFGPTITTNRPFSHFMLTDAGVSDIYH